MTVTLLDCTLRYDQCHRVGDYRYSATFRLDGGEDGRTVRVRLCHDGYRHITFAVAETLDDRLAWHRLLRTEPPPPPEDGDVAGTIERFARDLAAQARGVLADTRSVA